MRRFRAAIAIAALAWASTSHAAAPGTERADALFREGREAMKRQDYAAACGKFYESQKLDPAPGTLVNLGECEERLGHLLVAWKHLQEAVKTLPPGDERIALARSQAGSLEKRLARLTVRSERGEAPASLHVRRDGAPAAIVEDDGVLWLEPGRYYVEAAFGPKEPKRDSDVVVRAGEDRRLVLEPPGRPSTPLPAATARKASVEVPPPEPSDGSSQRTAGYVLAGTGVVALAVGAFYGFKASSTRSDALSICGGQPFCFQADRANTMLAEASDQRRVATIAAITGGVLVAGGLVIAFTAPSGKRQSVSFHIAPPRAGAGAGLSLGGDW